jgi:hypothetical protein
MTFVAFRFPAPKIARALTASLLWLVAGPLAASAQVPEQIAVPNATEILKAHAEGAQVYECKADSSGKLAWVFREPIATLLVDGKTVGHHFAGPSWEHNDGSVVVGKAVGNAPGATAKDIPWLKLEVAARRGSGIFRRQHCAAYQDPGRTAQRRLRARRRVSKRAVFGRLCVLAQRLKNRQIAQGRSLAACKLDYRRHRFRETLNKIGPVVRFRGQRFNGGRTSCIFIFGHAKDP